MIYVIPCGAAKLRHAAPARDLYTGSMFKHTLKAAETACERDGGTVLILSARNGLVPPEKILAPYNVKMGDAASVTVDELRGQAAALGVGEGTEVYALLPRAYLWMLDSALRKLGAYVTDVYEGTRGIGDQKAVNAAIIKGPAN